MGWHGTERHRHSGGGDNDGDGDDVQAFLLIFKSTVLFGQTLYIVTILSMCRWCMSGNHDDYDGGVGVCVCIYIFVIYICIYI